MTKDLKPIYTAINPDEAMLALEAFESQVGPAAADRRPGCGAMPGST